MKSKIYLSGLLILISTMIFSSCTDWKYTNGKPPTDYSISVWGEGENGKLVNKNSKVEITYTDQIGRDGVDGNVTKSINIPTSLYPIFWNSTYNDIALYVSFKNTTNDTLYVIMTNTFDSDVSKELDVIFNSTDVNNTIDDVLKQYETQYIYKKVLPNEFIEIAP